MMTMTRTLTENRRRIAAGDDGFAMMSVIMLIMVIGVLAVIVLSVVTSQVNPTLFAEKNTRTLAAAQAGLDAASSQLRNATTPDPTGVPAGDIHKLPCKVSGAVEGTGGETSYEATLQYYLKDPVGKDTTWRTDNALTCYTGTGTNGGVRSVPKFAMITSEGFDAASTSQVGRADRVVESAYTFQLTTRKIGGGMILDRDSSYCIVAGAAAPGSNLTYESVTSPACQEPNDLNSWTWANDYMLHLSATDINGKIPLCITGRASSSTPEPMTLEPCTTTGLDPLGQLWSWTGAYTWEGQDAANTRRSNTKIVNENKGVDAGEKLSVSTSVDNASLDPLPAVGKGNASYDTQQVVNFNQYGRCLDVTAENPTATYMIAFTCKQDPTGMGNIFWNHKWAYTEPAPDAESVPTTISVTVADSSKPFYGQTLCLVTTSTLTTVTTYGPPEGSGQGRFPRFVTPGGARDCSSPNTVWTRYGYSTDDNLAYTFVDSKGRCLSGGGPVTKAQKEYTSITVETCNGSGDQKWNVPDTPVTASLGDFSEVTGATGG